MLATLKNPRGSLLFLAFVVAPVVIGVCADCRYHTWE